MQVTQCHDLYHQIKTALAILWKCYWIPKSCASYGQSIDRDRLQPVFTKPLYIHYKMSLVVTL